MRARAPEACAALLLLAGCAGAGDAARRDTEALRAEVRELRQQNDELSRRVEALSGRVEALSARSARAPAPAPPREEGERPPLIPPDLAVVRVAPRPAASRARTPPTVPTAVPISAPDAARLDALSGGARDVSADADAELRHARTRPAEDRARALEAFAARYPRHPSADNALVEAAAAEEESGRADAACALARRVSAEYPAGDALPDALERLARCESRRGARDAERELLERLVAEFPRTPAAERAGLRLATISGRAGAEAPDRPARSSP